MVSHLGIETEVEVVAEDLSAMHLATADSDAPSGSLVDSGHDSMPDPKPNVRSAKVGETVFVEDRT